VAKIERPFDDFQIVDLSRPKGRKQLVELLHPMEESSSGAPYGVLDAVFGRHGLRSAVLEFGYLDVDHSRSYSQFYSRSFLDHSKRTTRVHFFTCRLTRPDLADLLPYEDDYLGYVVVRPLRVKTIGRSVLLPPTSPPNRYHFPTLLDASQVNLAGYGTGLCRGSWHHKLVGRQ
jgi:hypothetical protein